ncbi:DUF1566 domain-containing protein [Planctobacterium marinum]|uniref:Lcl C-terminal domain-containing protein n=1 Tax=Planctobacterium marinum TaxID=1631968 RepID=A0AA48KTQ2_9ALTE|nr:hypothetical protein MACH26_11660 [Planctobacterium marinum]
MNKLTTLLFALLFSQSTQAQWRQTCLDAVPASTPTEQFIMHDNGTVTDTRTNLMWQTCLYGETYANGTCNPVGVIAYWNEALDIAENAQYAGYDDWRLPNIKELLSIVENQCVDPAMNLSVFPGASGTALWSSSPFNDSNEIWFVFMNSGDTWHDGEEYEPYAFKLVRDANP